MHDSALENTPNAVIFHHAGSLLDLATAACKQSVAATTHPIAVSVENTLDPPAFNLKVVTDHHGEREYSLDPL